MLVSVVAEVLIQRFEEDGRLQVTRSKYENNMYKVQIVMMWVW